MSEKELIAYNNRIARMKKAALKIEKTYNGNTVYWLDELSKEIGVQIQGRLPFFREELFVGALDYNCWGNGKSARFCVTPRGLEKVIVIAACMG